MNLGERLLRGLTIAVVFGVLGGIASRLTVEVLLRQYFNASQQQRLESMMPYIWISVGFVTGFSLDRRVMSSGYLRPICWGAVASLTVVMLCVQIPMSIDPGLKFRTFSVFGMPFTLETAGLLSAPGALIMGGFLGGVFHYYFAERRTLGTAKTLLSGVRNRKR